MCKREYNEHKNRIKVVLDLLSHPDGCNNERKHSNKTKLIIFGDVFSNHIRQNLKDSFLEKNDKIILSVDIHDAVY